MPVRPRQSTFFHLFLQLLSDGVVTMATAADVATSNPAQDSCGHRLASCKMRFGATAELPFGGFPGAGIARNT